MGLVTPDFGLIFWMVLSFLIVLFILKKFAWKPILTSLKEREDSIENSLLAAEKARDEMERLNSDNERIMQEAREEREKMMKEAREIKAQMIHDAKKIAETEANKMIENAKVQIENEKAVAINEIKQTVIDLSVDIAQKLLKKNLDSNTKQEEFINNLLEGVKLN